MTTNPHFNNFNYAGEQDLAEQLVIESIKMYGHDIRYIPRVVADENPLFAQDELNQFTQAALLEVYIKSVEGFDGQGDFLSKFGIQIDDQVIFTVAQKRFLQATSDEMIMGENGWNMLQESGDEMVMEDNNSEGYSITGYTRPHEGDLIYFPLVGHLFEIKHVEHEEVFYQFGALQTYDLRCELFRYSSERFSTGNTAIDGIETSFSMDQLFYEMLTESGDKLLDEAGGTIIVEHRIEDIDATANNEFFASNTESRIQWSETNPFGDVI